MKTLHEEYLIGSNGQKKAVLLPIAEWNEVVEALEELDDIRAYDAAKQQPSESIPFDQAILEIDQGKVN